MNLNPFAKLVILLAEIIALISLLLPQSLFNSFSCEFKSMRQNYRATNEFFIDNEVIVIGTPDDLATVIGTHDELGHPVQVGSAGIATNLVEDCDLSYLNTRKAPNSNSIVEQGKFVMRLYEITDNTPVLTAIGVITDNLEDLPIIADPNYLTVLSDSTTNPCALPNSDGGGTGGGPFGDPGVPVTPNQIKDATDGFIRQWAFGPQGISWSSQPGLDGQEVRVGVFDTVPFRGHLPFFSRISIALPSPLWLTTWDTSAPSIVSNHGLFVAGLIHRIAPKSSVQLIRVLNDNGCGELWALNKGLEDYASRMSAWTGDLDETVINMSLGIRVPNLSEKQALDTLEAITLYADEQGAIIIAAAGNDSAPTLEEPNKDVQEMQVPASYDHVYGVTATNAKGERSCYSNKGDVAAPGGDSRFTVTKEDGTTEEKCEPRADTWDKLPGPNGGPVCTDMASCEYGLISLGQTRYGQQYIFWSGTSFAAPLVSGLAALAYEEEEQEEVKCLIQNGTLPLLGALPSEPNWGIINITKTFSTATLSKCDTIP